MSEPWCKAGGDPEGLTDLRSDMGREKKKVHLERISKFGNELVEMFHIKTMSRSCLFV